MRNGRTAGAASVSPNDSGNFTLNVVSSDNRKHNSGKYLYHGNVLSQKLNSHHTEKAENSRSPSLAHMGKDSQSATAQCC